MRINILPIFFFLASCARVHAQGFEWSEQIGGLKDERASFLASNDDGSLVVVGTFFDSVDVDPSAGVFMLRNPGGEGIFIQHIGSQGNLIWAGQIGGSGNARVLSICQDQSGNVLIGGTSTDTIDLDTGPGVMPVFRDAAFVAQLSPQCVFQRAFMIDDTGDLGFNDMSVDAGGNLYVAGTMDGLYDLDPGPGTFTMASSPGTWGVPGDCFVLKLDQNWNFKWAKKWGYIYLDGITDMAVDQEGMVYTCGRFGGKVDFDPGPGTFDLVPDNNSNSASFIHKMTPDGVFVWAKQITSSGFCILADIRTDLSNNILIGGTYSGYCDLDPGPGTAIIPSSFDDMFFEKFDKSGNMLWVRPITALSEQTMRGFDVDELGDIYATGWIKSTTDIDPGPGELILSTPANTAAAIIFKMDFLGNVLWGRQVLGTSFGSNIHIAANGTVYGSGVFTDQVNMNPGSNPVVYDPVAGYDAYVIKLNQDWNFYGTVFNDANANGIQDVGEFGVRAIPVLSSSGYATVTNSTGIFHFYEDISGDTVRAVLPWPGWQPTPAFAIADQTSAMNFAAHGPSNHDISATVVASQAFRPGFKTRVEISITNLGTNPGATASTVILSIQSPTVAEPLQFLDSSVQPVSQSVNSFEWHIPVIQPGETKKWWVDFKTLQTVPLATEILLIADASANDDVYLANNHYVAHESVLGSYDPNDKQVSPKAVPLQSMDTTDLQYVIRFQNTGTLPAIFVVLRDTLPAELDLSTLKVTAASHAHTWRLYGNHILEFRFDPINLPDSTSDETGSHGYVAFTAQAVSGLPLNTLIKNRAAIYFDYNEPVITNTSVMHVGTSVSVAEPAISTWLDFELIPNPAPVFSTLEVNLPKIESQDLLLQVFDASGRVVQQQNSAFGKNTFKLDGLPAGNYFVQLRAGNLVGGRVLVVK